MTVDLSAFYFDIRKDALYCDPPSAQSARPRSRRSTSCSIVVTTWLAPMLCFTAEEAWLARYPDAASVHLELFPDVPAPWRDDALAEKWRDHARHSRVVTGALELERAQKRIGSSLEAAPIVYVADPKCSHCLDGVDLAEICITSDIAMVIEREGPAEAFRLPEATGVAVELRAGAGREMRAVVEVFRPRRRRSALSRRDATRRAGVARTGASRALGVKPALIVTQQGETHGAPRLREIGVAAR